MQSFSSKTRTGNCTSASTNTTTTPPHRRNSTRSSKATSPSTTEISSLLCSTTTPVNMPSICHKETSASASSPHARTSKAITADETTSSLPHSPTNVSSSSTTQAS